MYILISKGVNVNLCVKNGINFFFVVCRNGNNCVVKFLLKYGVEIDY